MRSILLFLVATCTLTAEPTKEEIEKLSEAMGHLIGKNFQTLGLPLDLDAIVRGLHNQNEGKESPLSDEDCIEQLANLQQDALEKISLKNRVEADQFLLLNKENKKITSLEEGKLQYEVLKPGKGEEIQAYNTPLVRYGIRFLNGVSIPICEELIDLEEAIPGLKKALLGMKEGEERVLYIHPDLGYEGHRDPLHQDALLIFDIEILKADVSAEAHAASEYEGDLPLQISKP